MCQNFRMHRPSPRTLKRIAGQESLFAAPASISPDPTPEQIRERIQNLPYSRLTMQERTNLQRTITSRLPIGLEDYEQPEDAPEDDQEEEEGAGLQIVAELPDLELLEATFRSLT